MSWRLTADYPQVWVLLFAAIAVLAGKLLPHGPDWLIWPGLVLICAGGALMLSATITMRRHATTLDPYGQPAQLVTQGIFVRTRNPIYLGDLLAVAGLCLACNAPLAALLLVPMLMRVIRRRFIIPEENRLARAFPGGFTDYRRRTRRWI